MGEPGREKTVPDERILVEFLLTSDPALFSSEVADNVPLTRQRVNTILDEMEDDGYLMSKKASGRRLWWLTDKGHDHLTQFLRDELFTDDG